MATLFITELAVLGFDARGNEVLAPSVPVANEQIVPISGVSAASQPFVSTTRFIMVNTDTACCLAWGKTPTAVTTAHRMGANETRFYTVSPGDSLAVIASLT